MLEGIEDGLIFCLIIYIEVFYTWDYMEHSKDAMSQNEGSTTRAVRNAIIGVHDRYLNVAPINRDVVSAFSYIANDLSSRRGIEWREHAKKHIETWGKRIEISSAILDVVAGMTLAGIGMKKIIRPQRLAQAEETLRQKAPREIAIMQHRATPSRDFDKKVGKILLGSAGATWMLRPVTHLVDWSFRYGKPLAKKVAMTVDAMLLRNERKQATSHVFVGSSTS